MTVTSFKEYLQEAWDKPDFDETHKDYPYEHTRRKTEKQEYYENLYSDHTPSLFDKLMLKHYTGSAYQAVNENLWEHGVKGVPIKSEPDIMLGRHVSNEEYTHHLSKAIDKFPAAREDMIVYAGLHQDANIEYHIQNTDGIVHIPAFSSTSTNPGIASKFARDAMDGRRVLHIHIKEGQHVGAFIAPYSTHTQESEFLLKPNHLLKIHANPTTYADSDSGNKIHVFHAHILEPHEIEHIKDNPEVESYHQMTKTMDKIKSPTQHAYGDMMKDISTTSNKDKLANAFLNPQEHYGEITDGHENYEYSGEMRDLITKNPHTDSEVVSKIVKNSKPDDLFNAISYFKDDKMSHDSITHILKNVPDSDRNFVQRLVKKLPNYAEHIHGHLIKETN